MSVVELGYRCHAKSQLAAKGFGEDRGYQSLNVFILSPQKGFTGIDFREDRIQVFDPSRLLNQAQIGRERHIDKCSLINFLNGGTRALGILENVGSR
jgi:hypothetical protein